MTTIESITTILVSIGGSSAVVLGLSSWLGKVWAARIQEGEKARFAREQEVEKARFAQELETLKSTLSLRQSRLNLLHAKRAEILAELYQHLVKAYTHTFAMVGKAQRRLSVGEKSAEAALESVRAALNLLETRKIWLSEELAERVSGLIYGLQTPVLTYHYYLKDRLTEQDVTDAVDKWNAREPEVKQLLEGLENEFRAILAASDRS